MARYNSLLSYLDKTLPSSAFIAFKNFFSFLPFVKNVDEQIKTLRSLVNAGKKDKNNLDYVHNYDEHQTFLETKYPRKGVFFAYLNNENNELHPQTILDKQPSSSILASLSEPILDAIPTAPKAPEIQKKWTIQELNKIKNSEDYEIEDKISELYQRLANDTKQQELLVDDFINSMLNPYDARTALCLAHLIEKINPYNTDEPSALTQKFERWKSKFTSVQSFSTFLSAIQNIIINKLVSAINLATIGTAYQQELRDKSRRLLQRDGVLTKDELIQSLDHRVTTLASQANQETPVRSAFDTIIKCIKQLKFILGLGENRTLAKIKDQEAEKLLAEERAFNEDLDQRLQESGAAFLGRESYRY